ncbi:hypothetical protein E2542_SST03686 [Spatholobus suberectus]|nr:hypothetical protein E2542_SST03686 [Spatholobus suberectus]
MLAFVSFPLESHTVQAYRNISVYNSGVFLFLQFVFPASYRDSADQWGFSASSSTGRPHLTNLFKHAAHAAKKSCVQGRILRVILFYCRSTVQPQHQWPGNQKLFTLDVMYLRDKPGTNNCPQEVNDTLVEALEHVSEYESYILESGQGLARVLFRHVLNILLSHPQQLCIQEYVDVPKSIAKKASQMEPMATEDSAPISSQ